MSCQSHQAHCLTKIRQPWDRPRREATEARQLLAVVARYILALVRLHTGRSPALVYLHKDMAEVRLAVDKRADRAQVLPSAGMETDRDRGAVEAVDPTATTHLAHQKQRTVPFDLRRHAGADSDINYARVHADSNSQHAVEDTHTVEAWEPNHQALIPNFRTVPEKCNSFGGLPPVSAGGTLRVVAVVLNCRGSDIDSVDAAVEPQCFPDFRSFLLYLADTHAAVDTGHAVVAKGAGDADNRAVDHSPYFHGYPRERGSNFLGFPRARDLHCELLPGRVPARKSHPVSCLYLPQCTRVPNYGPEPRLVFWHGFLLYWYPPQTELTSLLPWSHSVK